jgi:AraC-like DNA-binding protein
MEDRQTFFIKGMVCNRCITVLKSALEELHLKVEDISLGKVTVSGLSNLKSTDQLEDPLATLGFELIGDRDQKLVEQIKTIIDKGFKIQLETGDKMKFSTLLSEQLNMSYDSLSAAFSKMTGNTLESYIIGKRIDKIKEFLVYTDLSLTEIAYLTAYSSIFHLSRQFKEQTSFNPSHYRKIKEEKKQLISKQKD